MKRLIAIVLIAFALGASACTSLPKIPPVPVISVSTADDFRAAKIKMLDVLQYVGEMTRDVDSLAAKAKSAGLQDNVYNPIRAAVVKLSQDGITAINKIETDTTLQRAEQLKAIVDPVIADINQTLMALQPVGADWKSYVMQGLSVAMWLIGALAKAGV